VPGTLVAIVLAQDTAPTPPAGGEGSPGFLSSMPLLIVIFVIFYFLMIRPQSKERRKREELLKTIKKHDQVVTTAGIHGEVVSLSEGTVKLEVADGVRMEFDRSAIWQVRKASAEGAPEEAPADAGLAGRTEKGAREKGKA
jgi:preprotein translocase subunit YajC